MSRPADANSPGDHPDLEAVQRVVDACLNGASEHVASIYLLGSHAEGTQTPQSDVDLAIVWKGGGATAKLKERVDDAMLAAAGRLELDVEHLAERTLLHGMTPALKRCSRLLFGDDQREAFPLVDIADWSRDRMHTSYWRMVRVFHRPQLVRVPLQFPYAAGEFFGYDQKYVRNANGAMVRSTRDLVRSVCWMATALIALRGEFVASQYQSAGAYRQLVGDEWAGLIDDLVFTCREKWGYLIPTSSRDREQLRAICERSLAFERHFLDRYRGYVLGALRSNDIAERNYTRWMMDRIPFDDSEIKALLRSS